MKRSMNKWILCGSAVCLSLFQSCSKDNEQIEAEKMINIDAFASKDLMLSANATASKEFSLNTYEENERMGKYFRDKYEAGEDITTELYDYVESMPSSIGEGVWDYNIHKEDILKAIDPDRYTCDTSNSKMGAYVTSSLKGWTFLDLLAYITNGFYPQVYAFYLDTENKDNEFGYNGEFTNVVNHTFKDLQKFWEINGERIDMVPMKGSIYRDKELIFNMHQILFGVPEENSRSRADKLYEWFVNDRWWNGDHPLLSLNAVAIQGTNPFTGEPLKRIVMGDGLLNAMDAIGYGDVAPQAILAHEYAHHIQYDYNLIDRNVAYEDMPNVTRKVELMADALAAYYLTHKKGGTINLKRLTSLMHVQTEIGDCSFASPGHHGTPLQREAAAEWGANLAQNAHNQGQELTSQEVVQLFEADYASILGCDGCLVEVAQ